MSKSDKSYKYAIIRNWSNQNPIPAFKITKITNSQNSKRTYGQPSGQLFPTLWPLINPNRTKNDIIKHKVKRHRNADTNKNRQQRTTTELPPWNGQ